VIYLLLILIALVAIVITLRQGWSRFAEAW